MSEQTTTTTSEQERKPVGYVEGAPEAVQLEALDALVGFKDAQRAEFGDVDDFEQVYDEKLEQVLASKGIIDDLDDEAKHAEYEFIKSVYQLTAETNPDDWKLVKLGDASKRIERSAMRQMVKEHYANPDSASEFIAVTTDPTLNSQPTSTESGENERKKSEALSEAAERVDTITKKYAEQVAERSKRMIESAKTREDINASKAELSDLIAAIATEYMLDIQGAENSDIKWGDMPEVVREEIVQAVDAFVAEQTDSVISQMEENRMAEYNNSRPIMQKFYDNWSSWGQEKGFITKGKLKKAAVFAVPGAALGAALIPLAGVVGFGAVTGGLAVMGARSVARRLAGAKLDNVADSKRVAEEQTADIRSRAEQNENADLLDLIDERTEAYRKRNLRRTAGGIAIAMTVGLITAKGADMIADNVDNWSFGKAGETVTDKWNNFFSNETAESVPPELPDRDGDGIPNATDTDRDGDGVLNGNDPAPNISETISTRDQLFDGRLGTRELTPEGREAMVNQLDGYNVKSGDTVWGLSEQFLQEQGIENPTTYEIDATKDILLKELQASGNADSQGWLSAGDTIKIK